MFKRAVANWLNTRGMNLDDRGHRGWARRFYRCSTLIDPGYSSPWYNLGLLAKYSSQWDDSLRFNRKAVEVNPKNEEAWWNLGIAATAVHNWNEARRAWKAYGAELEDGDGEVRIPVVRGCVRLNPRGDGEVVWGIRLDPARTVLLSVPLPESGHRFHDIVLNDGAPNGTRVDSNGREIPVFDELSVWEKSKYSTYQAHIQIPDSGLIDSLVGLCDRHELGIEDWSTVRFICKKCSEGSPGPHEHERDPDESRKTLAFGAKNYDSLMMVLTEWAAKNDGIELGHVELLLDAAKNAPNGSAEN